MTLHRKAAVTELSRCSPCHTKRCSTARSAKAGEPLVSGGFWDVGPCLLGQEEAEASIHDLQVSGEDESCCFLSAGFHLPHPVKLLLAYCLNGAGLLMQTHCARTPSDLSRQAESASTWGLMPAGISDEMGTRDAELGVILIAVQKAFVEIWRAPGLVAESTFQFFGAFEQESRTNDSNIG